MDSGCTDIMKNFLYSEEYKKTEVIGLDLDGTLYDEFEFINQIYRNITHIYSDNKDKKEDILYYMLSRWLEKGSSYAKIFSETKERFDLVEVFEEQALNLFRSYEPDLKLSSRIKFMLDKFKKDGKKIFLLTDGRKSLQDKKINALGIRSYFELIIIAEDYQKPNPYYSKSIKAHFTEYNNIVYIGDRERDKEFATKSGFKFVNINCMNPNLRD